MKLINIILDSDLEDEILTILRSHSVQYYSKFENVQGQGKSGPKYNNQVGPGINSIIYAIVEDDIVAGIMGSFKKLKENDDIKMTLKVFVSPVEQFI